MKSNGIDFSIGGFPKFEESADFVLARENADRGKNLDFFKKARFFSAQNDSEPLGGSGRRVLTRESPTPRAPRSNGELAFGGFGDASIGLRVPFWGT